MTKNEFLQLINETVLPGEPITLDTVILDCEYLDSMAMLTIFSLSTEYGFNVEIKDFFKAKTVEDLIDYILTA